MSEKEEKSHEEKVVDDHRQMLLLSGNISEFQEDNLKKWGFVLFGKDLKQAKIDYNFLKDGDQKDHELEGNNMCAGSVTFDFEFNSKQEEDYMKKAVSMLNIWTKYLFWKDTEVIVKIEGEEWDSSQ